jgi:hypothetical protein
MLHTPELYMLRLNVLSDPKLPRAWGTQLVGFALEALCSPETRCQSPT